MRTLFFLFSILSLQTFATETITYDMMLWGDKIGRVTITKTEKEDGSEVYVLDSYAKAKVLWILRESIAHMETIFKNGKMISSYQKEIENGAVKRWNRVTFDGTKYQVDGYKGKHTFTEAPVCAVAPLYFKVPNNITRSFYEAEAELCVLQKTDDNTWEFKGSDGSRNVYHYQNGKAVSMEFHVSIATVKLVRAN